jgi:plastocyanin
MPDGRYRLAGLAFAALSLAAGIALAADNVHRVVMKAADYNPQQVTVHVGDVVEWDNQDIVAHTATAADKKWDVNVMPGRSGRITMQVPGTFDYTCRYHPNMKAEIVVEP